MLIPFDKLFAKHGLKFKGVLHIGANVGEERFMYDKLGIKKQIWIEGNPEIFLKLKENISYNPDAVALNYVIGDENKETVLHISNNGSQSSSVLELGTHKQQHPEVHYIKDIHATMHRVDSLGLDLNGVDLLNIDLQGFEYQALVGMGELLDKFRAAYLEVNKDYVYKECTKIDQMDKFMFSRGFRRYDTLWIGNWGDALYLR